MLGKEVLNYTITEFVGKGGMGSVYVGVHKYITQKKVAIKVINSDMVNEFTRSKIKEEAEHLASLNHENIVKFQNLHIDDDGNILLIMEFADGYSLEKYINKVSGLIVEERICPIFEPILDGIGYAHKHKIIHKDIKPSNIIINSEGVPKILDFGIASIIKEGNEKEDYIMGTPSYMSPEQIRGAHIDERSDIYALGVLLHQLLTGHAPYDTTTLSETQIQQKVVEEPLPRMKTYYKYVSDKVQRVVDKATAKNPEDRYQSCAEFKSALHKAIYPSKVPTWTKFSAAAGVLLLVGACVGIWDYNRIKVDYYMDYVEQWGVPVGVHKLSSNEVNHRSASYRIESCRGKVRRMTLINYAGKVVSHNDSEHVERASDMLVEYGDNGKVLSQKVLDANGRVIYIKSYNDKQNVVTFHYDDEYNTELCLAKDITRIFSNPFDSDQDRGKISRYFLTYDANGYVTQLLYGGQMNERYCDINGIYGRAYKRDDKGRVIEEMYLGANGSIKATKKGLAYRRHTYDKNDLWTETHYYAADGTTGADENGTPRVIILYDKYGNRIGEDYVDDNGNYVIRTDMNACGARYELNEHGLMITHYYIGTDGRPCYGSEGYVKAVYEYDSNGFVSSSTLYDDQDSITTNTSGWAITKVTCDTKGNPLLVRYFNRNGDGVYRVDEEGAGFQREYDSLGNVILEYLLDPQGTPMMQDAGKSGVSVEYNEYNRPVRYTNLDVNGAPIEDIDGVGVMTMEYDRMGNIVCFGQYDASGTKRVNSKSSGYSFVKHTFSDTGDCTETAYYDAEGKLCSNYQNHYARIVRTYNDRGDVIKERYFDTAGQLMLVQGVAGYDMTYDNHGNRLTYFPVGLDGKQSKTHYEMRYTYDERDNQISSAYYDNGRAVENSDRIHRTELEYNIRNQIVEMRTYNVKNQLTPSKKDGYSIIRREYDQRGNIIRVSYYDANRAPVISKEGYATHISEYDAMGRVIHQKYYDEKGRPTNPNIMVPEGFCGYDKWGNVNFLASGDGNGNLIIGPNLGFSIVRMEYDIQGNLLWDAYYDTNDKPMMNKMTGYHKEVFAYDKYGNRIETAYYGLNDEPVLGPNKYHKLVVVCMETGEHLTETFIGKNGKKINVDGYCEVTYYYDKNGVNIRQTARKADGSLYMSVVYKGGEWVLDNGGTNTPAPSKVGSAWKSEVKELNAQLPMELVEDELVLQSIEASGNNCTMEFRLTHSKYELSESTLKKYIDMLPQILESMGESFPKSVTLIGVLRDDKDRLIKSISYKQK